MGVRTLPAPPATPFFGGIISGDGRGASECVVTIRAGSIRGGLDVLLGPLLGAMSSPRLSNGARVLRARVLTPGDGVANLCSIPNR
ncbi:hypothetical protein LIER_09871 [Lithospermum erythrorhizon]|uniref:Uncharacterized protein n=1 Tax=Lithospermum erythrorhizon TaxID=34254 RepID=A0AAV3PHE3_LITER